MSVELADFDSDLCDFDGDACIPQPDTYMRVDSLSPVVMWRAQYRNFGTHETLLANWTVDVDGQDTAGIRWVAPQGGR